MGGPHTALPFQSLVAALARHGGMYTLLDSDLMTARMGALLSGQPPTSSSPTAASSDALVNKLQAMAESFFYKLVDYRPGYKIHSELMAYISEPGRGNGVAYNEGVQPSTRIPAAFTFVGQFIDHDLTFNGMNLTTDQTGVIADEASPVIDLDNVYGPRQSAPKFFKIFDKQGRFILTDVTNPEGVVVGADVPRITKKDVGKGGVLPSQVGMAFILDPRNDENQLILQIHMLIQRFHNKLIDSGILANRLAQLPNPSDPGQIVDCVRKEVVATWQSFVLNEYMPAILLEHILHHVLDQIHKQSHDPAHPEEQYGDLKHKPLRDLVTGKNVVRMPHEFAIGFRFGHSQLRPFYRLNKGNLVLLFKDARASATVVIEGAPPINVSGKDDLKGSRPLGWEHVIDWDVFFPHSGCIGPDSGSPDPDTQSMLIDHKVTARVFNLPESTIPDDIKYVGNLPHRNLIRSSQIGVVSGEELAHFYKIAPLDPADILGLDDRAASRALFELDNPSGESEKAEFKTPLWYYILREAEKQSEGSQLGELGSRLVAEVLAGALYYGNEYPYKDDWKSAVWPNSNKICLKQIIDFVHSSSGQPTDPTA